MPPKRVPNDKVKCFMRKNKAGATYRTCVKPPKNEPPPFKSRQNLREEKAKGPKQKPGPKPASEAERKKKKEARETKRNEERRKENVKTMELSIDQIEELITGKGSIRGSEALILRRFPMTEEAKRKIADGRLNYVYPGVSDGRKVGMNDISYVRAWYNFYFPELAGALDRQRRKFASLLFRYQQNIIKKKLKGIKLGPGLRGSRQVRMTISGQEPEDAEIYKFNPKNRFIIKRKKKAT